MEDTIMMIIFIAGASASGKTTLSKKLNARLNQTNQTSQIISMDDYFLEIPDGVDIGYFRNNTNFDCLEMYDLSLLHNHLTALHNGETITKPIFDFPTNKRLTTERISPPEFLIVEGLFSLCVAKQLLIPGLAKLTVFTGTSSYLSLLNTRVTRDVNERSRKKDDVMRQEGKYVGPAFFNTIAKSKNGVDIDILNDTHHTQSGTHPLETGVDEIITALAEKQGLALRAR